MARPARTLVLVAIAIVALLAIGARAHEPVATKALLAKSAVTLKVAEAAVSTGSGTGDRSVAKFGLDLDGHGHFPRYQVCTVTFEHETKGLAHQCTSETIYGTGSIVSVGTLFLLNDVWTGALAVVGGTARFKTIKGEERVTFDGVSGTGVVKYVWQ